MTESTNPSSMTRAAAVEALKAVIRDVPDFPKQGVVFKDITPLLKSPQSFRRSVELLAGVCAEWGAETIVAIESRGFIIGGALADRLGLGLVPVRKPGKLPWRSVRQSYALEYGSDALEIHADALRRGERVIVVDDVLATGGTARATGELVSQLGAEVIGYAFLLELGFLNGRERLSGFEVESLIRY